MKYIGEYTKEISFPLGGIGSGSVGLGGDGRFVDWEIFNKPSKGSLNGMAHFAVKAITKDRVITKMLHGDLLNNLSGHFAKGSFGTGADSCTLAAFPHFKEVVFNGEFPIAEITFSDEDFPATVKMTAFNPFIPLNEDDSSIPGAFFNIEIINNSDEDIEYQVAFTNQNPFKPSRNEYTFADGIHTLTAIKADTDESSVDYSDISVSTDCKNTVHQTYWYRGQWRDHIVTFWNEFNSRNDLADRNYETNGSFDKGTLCAKLFAKAGASENVHFALTWNTPNMYNYWSDRPDVKDKSWKNYYAVLFKDSIASAKYALKNWERLYSDTLLFKNTLHSSTLDPDVIDAVSSTLSVLKSPTVFRLEDGTFYGWEGCYQNNGSCEGTCEHVWNYAYALCFLFPNLERSIRNAEFKYATDENGLMSFRMALPMGVPCYEKRPCLDGQMGSVIKTYREWKISGDDKWMLEKWPTVKKVIEYAWHPANPFKWDLDKDGVLEGRQHHTLDMELFGPSSWLESLYLLALKLGAEMAEFANDTDAAKEYLSLYESGCKFTKDNLFNGEYFIQKVDIHDKSVTDNFGASYYWNDEKEQIKYQIANGSEIDQMLGQWHAYLLGAGEIFDKEQMQTALDSMMKYNFVPSMRDFANPWRIFCLNDEAGAVMCAYPDYVEKPAIPVPYCEENMTGFEYAFAGLLIAAGKIDDGLKVVKAIRNRYDGKKRNPWNEIECGSNYARSMASFALLPIFSGFSFDLSKKQIGFAPIVNQDNYKCLFSLNSGWGYFERNNKSATVKLNGGCLTLQALGLKNEVTVKKVLIDENEVPFTFENGTVHFAEAVINDKIEIIL